MEFQGKGYRVVIPEPPEMTEEEQRLTGVEAHLWAKEWLSKYEPYVEYDWKEMFGRKPKEGEK